MTELIKSVFVFIILQIVLFVPIYAIWKNDCKKIGKENLAVSLKERFTVYVLCCPLWVIPFLDFLKEQLK